jgi:primosomal protein N' (replication factor Y) (superfamily II helicase)
MPILRIALDLPLFTLFDYTVADDVPVVVGQRVIVPFGKRQLLGVVWERGAESSLAAGRIKPVTAVLDDVPPLPAELLNLLRFCSDYYHFPLGQTVLAALPARLRSGQAVVQKTAVFYGLTPLGAGLNLAEFPARKMVQRRILARLATGGAEWSALKKLSATAGGQLKALEKLGYVTRVAGCTPLPPSPACGGGEQNTAHSFASAHALNAEQQTAVDAVLACPRYGCFLLHGITGSGKTEVYMHLMQAALRRGVQVLLLVPEINLTPQLEQYFRRRFAEVELVSLHSGLAEGARAQNWLHAQSGAARIVLGTRLAVFAPLPQLGLILVDEEHDGSFKQQDGLRYSARDVAIFRANWRGIPIVLGSATPSLESWQHASTGRYHLLSLTQRAVAHARLPNIGCIPLNQTPLYEGLSPLLIAALEQRLQRGEQSLLFLNRRGYAPVLMCTECSWVSGCPHCAGKLVLHQKDRRLRCHHCGQQQRVPLVCPSCQHPELRPIGIGTQRLEATLQARFPTARILRVDRDSTRNQGTWHAMRQQIEQGEVDILLGTQMLAKGHDFPNVTLVGVLNPDGGLYSADFRASEKLFAQLAQVAGRAGRADKAGEVLIQTAFPDHPLFRALCAHDYVAWTKVLLAERAQAGFPPFVHQVLLRAEGLQESAVYEFMHAARTAARGLNMSVEVYGVIPAALPKRANHFMAQLLVQCPSRKPLQDFIRAWKPQLDTLPSKGLRYALDIDPLGF